MWNLSSLSQHHESEIVASIEPEALIDSHYAEQQMPPTNLEAALDHDEERIDNGLCALSKVTRSTIPKAHIKKSHDLVELALSCSNIDEHNYDQMLKSLLKRSKYSIQQISTIDSEPLVASSALNLICNHFDCSKLTVFNVTGAKIHNLNGLLSQLSLWTHLEVLALSNTSLASIESLILEVQPNSSHYVFHNLTNLQLDYGNITELDFSFVLNKMPNLKHLSLVNNNIFNIYCEESLRPRLRYQFETVNLAGNEINCEKDKLWLVKLLHNLIREHKLLDYDQFRCKSPENLAEMTWAQRVSVLETSICNQCDCRSSKRSAIAIDCHNKNLTALPDILPLNTKILNLTSNRISSLSVHHNSKNWENVTYLHLDNNLITNFQTLDINSKFMRNLASLDIRRNKFQVFPSHIFQHFKNLDQIHLSNNPWLCDCENTFAFQEWLQRQVQKVGDKEDIICGIFGNDENGVRSSGSKQRLASKVIYRLSMEELCPLDDLEEAYDWLDVVNVSLGLMIGLILLKVTMDYIYQHRTKRLPHFFRLNF